MQAFRSLLAAFARLCKDSQQLANIESIPLLKEWEDYPKPIISAPPAYNFLSTLPQLHSHDVPEDQSTCPVCLIPFSPQSPFHILFPDAFSTASRLPCGHLICHRCLLQYLCPTSLENNNICPQCSTILFAKHPPPDTIEGLQARVDLAEWAQQVQEWPADHPSRRLIEQLKLAIAWHWYACAEEEASEDDARLQNTVLDPRSFDTKPVVEHQLALQELRLRRCKLQWILVQLMRVESVEGFGDVGLMVGVMVGELDMLLGFIRGMQG